jgi:hypothetical protein
VGRELVKRRAPRSLTTTGQLLIIESLEQFNLSSDIFQPSGATQRCDAVLSRVPPAAVPKHSVPLSMIVDRLRWLGVAFALAACRTSTPTPAPASESQAHVEQTQLQPGDLRAVPPGTFRPAVTIHDTTGECMKTPAAGERLRRILFLSPNAASPRRSASIALDSTGRVAGYAERRGDVGGKGSEPATSFSIDFRAGSANAMNERPGMPMEMITGTAAEFANRPDLDVAYMIELVRRRCAPPAVAVVERPTQTIPFRARSVTRKGVVTDDISGIAEVGEKEIRVTLQSGFLELTASSGARPRAVRAILAYGDTGTWHMRATGTSVAVGQIRARGDTLAGPVELRIPMPDNVVLADHWIAFLLEADVNVPGEGGSPAAFGRFMQSDPSFCLGRERPFHY